MRFKIFLLITFLPFLLVAQPKWKSHFQPKPVLDNLFHSTTSILLPTNTTLDKWEMEFDVVHHFYPRFQEGFDALFGLDGPAINRLSLSFAPTNSMLLTLARSNQFDNYSFELKYKIMKAYNRHVPFDLGFYGVYAWNAEIFGRSRTDSKNFQYLVAFNLNFLPSKKLAVGIMPGWLYNADIFSAERIRQLFLGIQFQYYISRMVSIPIEFIPVLTNRITYHSFAAGIELETGGHFFKLFITNNVSTNPTLMISNADLDFRDGDFRIGFMITRLLVFKKSR